jgi:bifunctional non-homologous end joining protein LigD
MAADGEDLRQLPLHLRKNNLARLLDRLPEDIFAAHLDEGELDPLLFPQACKFGLEGFVSKRRDSQYRAGPSKHWVKVKNPKHPAMHRVKESFR